MYIYIYAYLYFLIFKSHPFPLFASLTPHGLIVSREQTGLWRRLPSYSLRVLNSLADLFRVYFAQVRQTYLGK